MQNTTLKSFVMLALSTLATITTAQTLSFEQEAILSKANEQARSSYANYLPSIHELKTMSPSRRIQCAKKSFYSWIYRAWSTPSSNSIYEYTRNTVWQNIEQQRVILLEECAIDPTFINHAALVLGTLTTLALKTKLILDAFVLEYGYQKPTLAIGDSRLGLAQILILGAERIVYTQISEIERANQQLDRCTTTSELNEVKQPFDLTNQQLKNVTFLLSYLFDYHQLSHIMSEYQQQLDQLNNRCKVITKRIQAQEQKERAKQAQIEAAYQREQRRKERQLQEEREKNAQLQWEQQQTHYAPAHHTPAHHSTQRIDNKRANLIQHINDAIVALGASNTTQNQKALERLIKQATNAGYGREEWVNVANERLSEARGTTYMVAQEQKMAGRTPVERDMHAQLERTTINIEYVEQLLSQARSQNITVHNSVIMRRMVDRLINAIRDELAEIIAHGLPSDRTQINYLLSIAQNYGMQSDAMVQQAYSLIREADRPAPSAPPASIIVGTEDSFECPLCFDERAYKRDILVCPKKGCHFDWCRSCIVEYLRRHHQCHLCHAKVNSINDLRKCQNPRCEKCH